jgi:hypothetical protein
MNEDNLNQLASSLDSATLELLGPLRTTKTLDQGALERVKGLIDQISACLGPELLVSRDLTGRLWFVFTAMLAEAEHAKANRQQIETEAWDVQERLRRLFGPHF